jgi:hypothetical protein
VIPTIIAKGSLSNQLLTSYQKFNYDISGVDVTPLEYIGFNINSTGIDFTKYL